MGRAEWLGAGAVLVLVGCGGGKSGNCDATPLEGMPNVLALAFASDGAEDFEVVWWTDEGDPLQARSSGEDHTVHLLGMPAQRDVHWEVTRSGDTKVFCEGSATTGALAANVDIEVETMDADRVDGRFASLGLLAIDGPDVLVVIDRTIGAIVWAREHTERDQSINVRPRRDGGFLYDSLWMGARMDSAVVASSWTGDTLHTFDATGAHHEFVELPDGAIAYLAFDVREAPHPDFGYPVEITGDAVIEVAADGTRRTVWSSWDSYEVRSHKRFDHGSVPGAKDWTHANSLFYDVDQDRYLVSLGHLDTIAEVDRATGALLQSYGTDGIPVEAPGQPFAFQHSVTRTAAGTLLMSASVEQRTYQVEYEADPSSTAMREVWSHGLEGPARTAVALGSAERTPKGHTVASYGFSGIVEEIDENDVPVFTALLTIGDVPATVAKPSLFDTFVD